MGQDCYTTRVSIVVEISHYGTPHQAVQTVTGALKFPAIASVEVLEAESNFEVHQPPNEHLSKVTL